MQRTAASIATGLAAILIATPALADDRRRDRDDRREWNDNRSEQRAYAKGYKKGVRADDRRDDRQAYANGYRAGVRADNRRDYQRYGQNYGWNGNGYSNGGYYYNNPQWRSTGYRNGNQNQYYWGSNGQMHCRKQDGTTGLIVGALAGGTLGNVIAREGDKRLGSVIGGTLGAVLGNELAKGNVRCR